MKEKLKNSVLHCLFVVLLLVSCNSKKESHSHTEGSEYTCPMHPGVVKDEPGSCPVCGMDLVPKAIQNDTVKVSSDLADLLKSPNEVVIARTASVKPVHQILSDTLNLPGIITYDTRNISTISARFGGRIERLYLKYAYQKVDKGQKIAEVYSPEIVTAQRELLYIDQTDPTNKALIENAKRRLYLLGLSLNQVNQLMRSRKENYSVSLFSPYEGFLVTTIQQAPSLPATPTSTSEAGGMGDGGSMSTDFSAPATTMNSTISSPPDLIQEGTYINRGQALFQVINFTKVWAEVSLPSSNARLLKKGKEVLVKTQDNKELDGSISVIQPFYSDNQSFVKIRIALKNDNLRVGQLVNAFIIQNNIEGLFVPASSILNLGNQAIAFIKEGNTYTAKPVIAGQRVKDKIQILKGLSDKDQIAVNAQFLVDSESFIATKE